MNKLSGTNLNSNILYSSGRVIIDSSKKFKLVYIQRNGYAYMYPKYNGDINELINSLEEHHSLGNIKFPTNSMDLPNSIKWLTENLDNVSIKMNLDNNKLIVGGKVVDNFDNIEKIVGKITNVSFSSVNSDTLSNTPLMKNLRVLIDSLNITYMGIPSCLN